MRTQLLNRFNKGYKELQYKKECRHISQLQGSLLSLQIKSDFQKFIGNLEEILPLFGGYDGLPSC